MKLLLDTNAILYFSEGSSRLSARAYQQITQAEADIFVCVLSVGEIACLQQKKRIRLPHHWKLWFRNCMEVNGWSILPVTLEVMEEAYSLPDPIHRDPVDRILIAAARVEKMTLITSDQLILNYPHVQSLD